MVVKILLVSNDPLMNNGIGSVFSLEIKANKYQLIFAVNDKEALEKVKSNPDIQLAIVSIVPKCSFIELLPDDHKMIPSFGIVTMI